MLRQDAGNRNRCGRMRSGHRHRIGMRKRRRCRAIDATTVNRHCPDTGTLAIDAAPVPLPRAEPTVRPIRLTVSAGSRRRRATRTPLEHRSPGGRCRSAGAPAGGANAPQRSPVTVLRQSGLMHGSPTLAAALQFESASVIGTAAANAQSKPSHPTLLQSPLRVRVLSQRSLRAAFRSECSRNAASGSPSLDSHPKTSLRAVTLAAKEGQPSRQPSQGHSRGRSFRPLTLKKCCAFRPAWRGGHPSLNRNR